MYKNKSPFDGVLIFIIMMMLLGIIFLSLISPIEDRVEELEKSDRETVRIIEEISSDVSVMKDIEKTLSSVLSSEISAKNGEKTIPDETKADSHIEDAEECTSEVEAAEEETVVEAVAVEEIVEETTYNEEPVEKTETPAYEYYWDGSVLTATKGVNYGPSGKETYYNLPMEGIVQIMRDYYNNYDEHWIREDGCHMLGEYIMVAADFSIRPRGSLVPTSLGMGIVCDTGGFIYNDSYQLDIAVVW